jgi:hypothetical protein
MWNRDRINFGFSPQNIACRVPPLHSLESPSPTRKWLQCAVRRRHGSRRVSSREPQMLARLPRRGGVNEVK